MRPDVPLDVLLIGAAPVAVTLLVYDHKLNVAIRREISCIDAGPGEEVFLPPTFVSHWTRLAVLWSAASSPLGLVLLFLTGRMELPGPDALGVFLLVLVAVAAVVGLSAGAIVQRHIRRRWWAEP